MILFWKRLLAGFFIFRMMRRRRAKSHRAETHGQAHAQAHPQAQSQPRPPRS